MCITEYNEELHISNEKAISREEGRENAIFESVRDCDYSAQRGAQKLGISLDEFMSRMQEKFEQ